MDNYIDFKTYMRALVDSNVDTKHFFTGDVNVIANATRDLNLDEDYPILWLEVPDVTSLIQPGNPVDPNSCAFAILAPMLERESYQDIENQLDELYVVAKEFVNKMKQNFYDTGSPALQADGAFKFEAVNPRTAATLTGWRVEFRLDIITDDCVNPLKWQ